jgi:hypothetical protein
LFACLFDFTAHHQPTQIKSYGAEKGKMILTYFECFKFKLPHLLEVIDAQTPMTRTHLAASYDHAEINRDRSGGMAEW